MQGEFYTISKKDLFDLFTRLTGKYRIYVPYAKGDRLYFDKFDPKKEDLVELGGVRQSEPFKSFLSPAREKVVDGRQADTRPVLVAGVKACDLASLIVQDFVFQGGDIVDPFYAARREKTFIIACDCTHAKETCFCMAMEGAPYPRRDFDLGLSLVDNYYLVEAGSHKGRALIDEFRMFFKTPSAHAKGLRDSARKHVEKQVGDFIGARGTPSTAEIAGTVKANYGASAFWQEMASTCVECGACNLACPTCHCFLLYDEKDRFGARRFRAWDACLYSTFARVAGGHNPRRHLWERLRNRFDKKFSFFPEALKCFACTGCGRCIDACAGDIDIREVLKGLVSGKWNKPPHD